MNEPVRWEILTWGEVYDLVRKLAQAIRAADYQPDVVVAIARGGFVPARILCDLLDIYELTSMRVVHYHAGMQKARSARVTEPVRGNIRNQRVLLVDDVTDTGDTLQVALEHVRAQSPTSVKVALLHHKQVSPIEPDFFAQQIVKWRWLTYPWAVIEDVTGVLRRMDPQPQDCAAAEQHLKQRYGIKLSRQALNDAYAMLIRGDASR